MSNEGSFPPLNPQSSAVTAGSTRRPPHPLDGKWHLFVDGQTFGPYSGHDFRSFVDEGRVDASTNVARVGSDAWSKAGEDPALAHLFSVRRPLPPPANLVAEKGATIVQVTNTIGANLAALDLTDDLGEGKSPGLALILSIVICGAGQMYNGQVAKGILMLVGCVLLWLVALGWIINIWSWIDAYVTAKKLRARHRRRLLAAGFAG